MKKIYSFCESAKAMTIIAVASMMLTSVFGFTSCQKDEVPAPTTKKVYFENTQTTTVEEQKAKQEMNYFGYQLFVNDDLLALGDVVVTANYDGKTVEYKASEGQSATANVSHLYSAKDQMEGAKKMKYTGKKLVVPTFKASSHSASFSWKFVPNQSATASLDKAGSTDVVVLWAGMANNTNNISLDASDASKLGKQWTTTFKKDGGSEFYPETKNSEISNTLNSRTMFDALRF